MATMGHAASVPGVLSPCVGGRSGQRDHCEHAHSWIMDAGWWVWLQGQIQGGGGGGGGGSPGGPPPSPF